MTNDPRAAHRSGGADRCCVGPIVPHELRTVRSRCDVIPRAALADELVIEQATSRRQASVTYQRWGWRPIGPMRSRPRAARDRARGRPAETSWRYSVPMRCFFLRMSAANLVR